MSTTPLYARRWQSLIVLAFSLLVVTVGNTILNVGLPTIQEELDASASELQWIVDGYLLLFAGLLLAAGSLGDRFGRRRALLTGLVVFGAGSAWASFAGSPAELAPNTSSPASSARRRPKRSPRLPAARSKPANRSR